jgi:DNA polymerase-3 subunit gamma/tau
VAATQASGQALDADGYAQFVAAGQVRGPTRELAANLVLQQDAGDRILFLLDPALEHLKTDTGPRTIGEALGAWLGRKVQVQIDVRAVTAAAATPAARAEADKARRQDAAEQAIAADPLVRRLIDTFDAEIVPGSTRTLG